MKIMHKEWQKLYPNSKHSAKNLQIRLWHDENKEKAEEQVSESLATTEWTPEMCYLEECYMKAVTLRDMKNTENDMSLKNVMLSEWKKMYPESQLSEDALFTRVCKFHQEMTTFSKMDKTVVSNEDCVSTDLADGELNEMPNCDKKDQNKSCLFEHANMLLDQGKLYSMRLFGERHSAKPLFDGLCYNCGMMLFGRVSEGHKFLIRSDAINTDQVPVEGLYENKPTLTYKKTEVAFYSCKVCSKGICQLFPCIDPRTGYQNVPKELENLKTSYEHGQVSLCGLFSTILKRADPFRRVWPHFSGEVNILHKLNRHYYGMYGFMVAKEKPEEKQGSHERIVTALKWRRINNPLYVNFFSNYDTLYRFRPENPLSVAFAHGVRDAKGSSLEEQLGQKTAALVVPFSEDRNAPQLNECEDVAGIQHPERKPEEVSKAERDILLATKVTYHDSNLEAKAWPHLFPYGTGSWDSGLGLSPTGYCKLRLLNYSNRWRKDPQWAFFWFDRLTKNRIFYYNRARRGKRIGRDELLTSMKVKGENPYDAYGTEVPNTIPGSKGYWSARLLDET